MLVKLDDRLAAIAGLVLPGQAAADIGTDHNYLPAFLLQRGVCPRVIASDKADGPYRNAVALTRRLGLEQTLEVRRGQGLEVLNPGEAATIIIAGMGGRLTIEILAAAPAVLAQTRRLVLQPQRDLPQLRRWLAEHGWRIVAERMAYDHGWYYTALAAEPGEAVLTPQEAEFGPCLLNERPQLWLNYLRFRLVKTQRLLEQLAASGGSGERAFVLRREQAELTALLGQDK